MKIVCDRTELFSALAGVTRAVSPQSSLPILEGVLLEAKDGNLSLTGYNLEMSISTFINCENDENVRIVIKARLFQDMVRKLISDTVTIEINNLSIRVIGGITKFNFTGMNADDYPELPSPQTDPAITIEAGKLQEIIDYTYYAIAQNDQKPVHTGSKFIIEDGKLTVVSVDGYRLAICEREISTNDDKSFVIPGKALNEINHLIEDQDSQVSISTSKGYGVISFGNYTVATRLLEGDFLDFRRAIPDKCITKVEINVSDFSDSVERASLIITDRFKSPIRIKFADGIATITCSTSLGNSYDEIVSPMEGTPVEIGFNNRYILDALKNSRCEKVSFEIAGPTSPMKIVPVGSNDFMYLVLPVRIRTEA